MTLLLLPLSVLLTTLIGWCGLRLTEGREAVLTQVERWALGFLLGLTGTLYVTFLAHIALGVPLTFWGFLGVRVVLLACVVLPTARLLRRSPAPAPPPAPAGAAPRWARLLLAALLCWAGIKILFGAAMLVTTPAYLDDTLSNWNLRGKLFYETQALTLILPTQPPGSADPSGISSYPPTIPLAKVWLATVAGRWDEGLANGIHLLWYLAALAIVFCLVRRASNALWGAAAVYLLASLPLYLIQGTNPYGDVFLSAHIAAAVGLLFFAVRAEQVRERLTFLRLAAVATALLPFTKNEGLVLYLPIVLVVLAGAIVWMLMTKRLTPRYAAVAIAWFAGLLLLVAGPWIAFKLAHGLPFGNAKGISGLGIEWQPGVIQAIVVNTFFEGNWLLLFPLLILLFAAAWRAAFRTPLAVFSAAFLLLYLGQMPLFLFTGLSTEATYQTGYARGLIHLMPIVIVLTTLLLRNTWEKYRI